MINDKLKWWIDNPWRIGKSFARRGWLDFLPDKMYLSILYRAEFPKKLNWKHPKTFNEKLQWLKVYDRNPEYSRMVDKFEAKQFALEKIGSEYIVPAVAGPWQSFDEIDFDSLPEQFVLKTTHDCGGVLICKNKQEFDHGAARAFMHKHLQDNYYRHCREWPYKNIAPRIFAEQYLDALADGDLKDYKFFCFDGVPKLMFIASDRQAENQETKFDFFDMDFRPLSIINGHPNADHAPERPKNFERMKELAAVLSAGIPHLRVDFYECDGCLYLGELTFFHWGGLVSFQPEIWDTILGSWLELPNNKDRSGR